MQASSNMGGKADRFDLRNEETKVIALIPQGACPLPALPLFACLLVADVDGTLIRSIGKEANKLHKECFTVGFKEVFGLDTHIDIIPHHGGTDPLIVLKVLEHHGVAKEEVWAC